jgi:hypothetical protein
MPRIDAIEVEIICCGGGAKPTDTHLVLPLRRRRDRCWSGAPRIRTNALRAAGCDLIRNATAGGEELNGFTSRQPL